MSDSVRILKIINTLCILCIFLPFFRFCTSTKDAPPVLHYDSSETITEIVQDSLTVPAPDDKNILASAWENLTTHMPNTISGFGFLVRSVYSLLQWDFDITIITVFANLSIILTIISMIKLMRQKILHALLLYLSNIMAIIAVGISFYVDNDSALKYGFYLYAVLIFTCLILTYRHYRITIWKTKTPLQK